MIGHHLDDATLMSCATGTLTPALAVVAASHVAVCSRCREGLSHAERLGGAVLADLAPVPLGGEPPAEEGALDHFVSDCEHRVPGGTPAPEVPRPLSRLVGTNLDALRWWPLGMGVWQHRVRLGPAESGTLVLIKVSPGRDVPAHGHNGAELTLILRGSYADEIGRFAEGDLADLDEAIEHHPVAGAQGCICVLACERPARFHGLLARLMQPLTGF